MASMASLDLARPSSVDSDRPMSHLSSRSASSVSLASSIVSSESDTYYSCTGAMPADLRLLDKSPFSEAEFNFPLDIEADEQPSTVLIYLAEVSPVASPDLSSCSPLPFPSTQLSIVDCAMQSGEHDFPRLSEWATLVVWDPRLPGAFPPNSNTSILPSWWHNAECLGTFGYPAFMRLQKPVSYAGRFSLGDPCSDDMEGRPVWDPSAPETSAEHAHRIELVQRRCIAILDESADREYQAASRAALEA